MIMKKELMILGVALALAGCDQGQRGETGMQSSSERGSGTNDMGGTVSHYDTNQGAGSSRVNDSEAKTNRNDSETNTNRSETPPQSGGYPQ
jgi:hypothetical protein